jgi:DNA-directed RNA polymerase specialized sigma24 family protein
MSAALTLPYVWATAAEPLPEAKPNVVSANGVIFYRRRTENLLHRYLRASMAVGRVPAVTQEVAQRGRASSCRMKNFEDVVIFTIDVEKCLKRLEPEQLQLVVKIALQEYMYHEVAAQLKQDVRTIVRKYGKALDHLTVEFLKGKLLDIES